MKNKIKEWLVLLLAGSMIFSMAFPAYAETMNESKNEETETEYQDTCKDSVQQDIESIDIESDESIPNETESDGMIIETADESTGEPSDSEIDGAQQLPPEESEIQEGVDLKNNSRAIVNKQCGPNATYTITDSNACLISGTGSLWDGIFRNNLDIKVVDISGGITDLGEGAFSGCRNINRVQLHEGLLTIGKETFRGCYSISSINIPSTVNTIGPDAFSFCANIKELKLTESLTSIGSNAFRSCTGLVSINIPSGITTIASGTFNDCERLESVSMSENLNSIEDYAFTNCYALNPIDIPSKVLSIGQGSFSNCSSLTTVDIPSNLTYLGQNAFSGCTNLTNVNLGDGVTEILTGTFLNCPNLETVDVPLSLESFQDDSLQPSNKLTVYCIDNANAKAFCESAGVSYVYQYSGETEKGNTYSFDRASGTLTVNGQYHKWRFTGDNAVKKVILNNLTSICKHGFENFYNLEEVEMPDSVDFIGEAAFMNCTSLKTIKLSPKIGVIDLFAFYNCSKLQEVILPDELLLLTSSTFEGCSSLKYITIPESLSRLGYATFKGCTALKEVEIKSKPKYIEGEIFADCINLEKINIPPTATDIADNSFNNCSKLIIYGYSSSNAQNFAQKHNIPFKYLEGIFADPDEESIEGFVVRLYKLILSRDADGGGFDLWRNKLRYGKSTGADVGIGFVFSKEFIEKNLSNDAFVEIMYKTFLNRPADGGGKQNWVNLLENGVSRMYVYKGLAESNEFGEICERCFIRRGNVILTENRDKNAEVTKFVNRLYTVCLGRPGEEGGLNNWTGQINNHETSPKDAAKGFIFSKELQEKNLSDEDYVELHYNAFMGRGADALGKANWVRQLESGKITREDLFWGFANSNEFEEIIASYGL